MPRIFEYRGSNHLIKQFDERNGGKSIFSDRAYRYPNGALRDQDPLGFLMDPPNDPKERQDKIVSYWKHFTELAVDDFYKRREEILAQADYLANAGAKETAEKELRQLQDTVLSARRSLADAENEALRLKWNAATVAEALEKQRLKDEQDTRFQHGVSSRKSAAVKSIESIRV